MFDLIQVDLASAAEAREAGRLFSATALAARALLVARGEQADTDWQSLELFRRHFVEPGVVPAEFKPPIEKAQGALAARDPEAVFSPRSEEVVKLLTAVRELYESMGPSLRLPAPACAAPLTAASSQAAVPADVTQDLRGVVCPLNYGKAKMTLGKLNAGQVLALLLDEKGSQNVPASAANDGHEVLSVAREAQHWRVAIRKGQ